MTDLRKKGLTALKILISAALVYFIFTKLDLADLINTVQRAQPGYLLLALLFFVLSKFLAAWRLNVYFHEIEVPLTRLSNLRLYILGMFYNLFLPGGIGGDAYKGYVIKKKFGVNTKKVVSVLVLDRLSGLLLLCVYFCVLALLLENEVLSDYKWLLAAAIPLGIVIFYFVKKQLFSYVLPVFWKSIGLSALVQMAQLVCVLCILKSLGVETDTLAYLAIFLISSIVSVIPLTIGGIGSRELTFYYGAAWLGLNESTSVGVSMVFFLITALVSLVGILYHFKKTTLELDQ